MKTLFSYLLLMGIFIVIIFIADIENKFPIMIGAIIGGTIAFIIGQIIIYRNKKKK